LGNATYISGENVYVALRHIFMTEGIRGMFKGISLNLVKNPLATGVSFLVNDMIKEVRGFNIEISLYQNIRHIKHMLMCTHL
jgi:hypothetical protein